MNTPATRIGPQPSPQEAVLQTPRGSIHFGKLLLAAQETQRMSSEPGPAKRPCGNGDTPIWRIRFGNIAQIGTLVTSLTALFGGAAWLHGWDKERRAEALVQGLREGERAQLLRSITETMNGHTIALSDLVKTIGSTREDVRRLEGKVDRLGSR